MGAFGVGAGAVPQIFAVSVGAVADTVFAAFAFACCAAMNSGDIPKESV